MATKINNNSEAEDKIFRHSLYHSFSKIFRVYALNIDEAENFYELIVKNQNRNNQSFFLNKFHSVRIFVSRKNTIFLILNRLNFFVQSTEEILLGNFVSFNFVSSVHFIVFY